MSTFMFRAFTSAAAAISIGAGPMIYDRWDIAMVSWISVAVVSAGHEAAAIFELFHPLLKYTVPAVIVMLAPVAFVLVSSSIKI